MNDFERQLQRLPLRSAPAEWRREILGRCARPPENSGWSWREWLWPSPQAWAAMAAVWIVCAGVAIQHGPGADGALADSGMPFGVGGVPTTLPVGGDLDVILASLR